jgi:CHAT domain-containing protein/Tfp pilus assembly protein PilF
MSADIDALLTEVAARSEHNIALWIEAHRSDISESLLRRLKDRYADGDALTSNPERANTVTNLGMQLASARIELPRVMALAKWARANWASLYDPSLAIQLYSDALTVLQNNNDALDAARIHGSLSYLYTITGQFDLAHRAHTCALPEFERQLGASKPVFFLRLLRNFGGLLHCEGRYAEALVTHDKAIALATEFGHPSVASVARMNRALTLGMLGRLNEVEQEFLAERVQAVHDKRVLDVARLDMNLGDFYAACGRPAEALRSLHLAEKSFLDLGNPLEASTSRWSQGVVLQRIGVLDAAAQCFAGALSEFETQRMQTEVADLYLRLAQLRRQCGDFSTAAVMIERALTQATELGNPRAVIEAMLERAQQCLDQDDISGASLIFKNLDERQIQTNLLLVAHCELLRGDASWQTANAAQAIEHYSVSNDISIRQQEKWLIRRTSASLGRAFAQNQPDIARRYLLAAAKIDDDIRVTLNVEELKAGFQGQSGDVFEDLIDLALRNEQPAEAMSYVWRAKSSAFLDLFTQQLGELPSKRDAEEMSNIRQQLSTLHWAAALQDASVSSDSLADDANRQKQALEARLLDLRRKRVTSRDDVDTPAWITSTLSVLAQMDVDALLEYAVCKGKLIGFYADRTEQCIALPLVEVSSLRRLLTRLRLKFTSVLSLSTQDRTQNAEMLFTECEPLLRQLHDILIAPILTASKCKVMPEKIAIAPCAPLFTLPFAALRLETGWLGEVCEIEMIQSGALFGVRSNNKPVDHAPSMVICATSEQVTAVRDEARAVSALLPRSRLFVDVPMLHEFEQLDASPQVVHIAAHTLQKEDVPIFTGLKLTQEVLTVERCYSLPLRDTELVTLSGCTTASGLESGGQLLSFQQALFVAGAKRMLTSLHVVPDETTADWMKQFYAIYATGASVAESLRRTQRDLSRQPECSHPAIWGAFACWRR